LSVIAQELPQPRETVVFSGGLLHRPQVARLIVTTCLFG
jgi:hypothetical protein